MVKQTGYSKDIAHGEIDDDLRAQGDTDEESLSEDSGEQKKSSWGFNIFGKKTTQPQHHAQPKSEHVGELNKMGLATKSLLAHRSGRTMGEGKPIPETKQHHRVAEINKDKLKAQPASHTRTQEEAVNDWRQKAQTKKSSTGFTWLGSKGTAKGTDEEKQGLNDEEGSSHGLK